MARTLSDTLIIAMIEAATRLAGGRGPITGSAAAQAAQPGAAPAAGQGSTGESTGAMAVPNPPAATSLGQDGTPAGERDLRTAEQIGADFKTIYTHIEGVVRASAEQETRSVGFGPR